jgi:hypothetical protein
MTVAPKVQPARATTTAQATPDYVAQAHKADEAVLSRIEKNPLYKAIFEGNQTKEARIAAVTEYLIAGLADGSAKPEELDKRREELAELNASIQVIRRQLGAEQAKEITNKAYADFQKIVTMTSTDVEQFQEELAPLCDLAELFSKYGADGNLIENINKAKAQKREREERTNEWWELHEAKVVTYQKSVRELEGQIRTDKAKLEGKMFWRSGLAAQIVNNEAALAERQKQLAEAQAETPPDEIKANGEIEPVNEEILDLQNIGGEKFKAAVTELRDHTEEALAKISENFDEAITGLTNARESFIAMDRNCGDATFALSVLEVAVQEAEQKARDIAKALTTQETTATGTMANLERMEREQRSAQLLGYTSSLTTFLTNIGVAVASLRSGQTVIQQILRMNSAALEQANTHKITGIANTADAVTITIGSIIEVCNRAASTALADGLTRIRAVAERGSARLVGGEVESLQLQNTQLTSFIQSVADLKQMTHDITANSVGLLQQQFALVAQMRDQSAQLGEATSDAQRASFQARAGVVEHKPADEPETTERRSFRMRIGES